MDLTRLAIAVLITFIYVHGGVAKINYLERGLNRPHLGAAEHGLIETIETPADAEESEVILGWGRIIRTLLSQRKGHFANSIYSNTFLFVFILRFITFFFVSVK
jgi:hypothetical protein